MPPVVPSSSDISNIRTLRACDACRSKKIKCDGVKPKCDACKHSNLSCVYLKPHRKLASKSREISGRRIPIQSSQRKSPTTTNPTNDSDVPKRRAPPIDPQGSFVRPGGHLAFNLNTLKDQITGCKLGDVDSYDGHSLLSADTRAWITLLTGEDVDFGRFTQLWSSTSPEESHKIAAQFPNPYSLALPTKFEILEIATFYFASKSHAIFPVFSRDIAMTGIEQIYPTLDAKVCVSSGRAAIFTMIAFFSSGFPKHHWLAHKDGDTFSNAALQLLPDILREGVTVGGFGAIAVMCAVHSTFGDVNLLEQLLAIAARMMFKLKGHLNASSTPIDSSLDTLPGIPITPALQNHLRKIFWALYSLDKDICFRTLRPPMINDDDCDMDFGPSTDRTISISSPSDESDGLAFHPGDVQLAILKGKIYRKLYSAKASRLTASELLKTVRELDEDLDMWRSDLPVLYQPERSRNNGVSGIAAQNVRLLLLHLEYYQSLTMIHKASTRYSSWDEQIGQSVVAIQSSVDLCLEASRSTIYYLEASKRLPGGESFWLSSQYPIPSLVLLFRNLLQHPTHPRAAEDITLLETAPAAFNLFKSYKSRKEESNMVQVIHSFFIEMVRLAKCAVNKAAQS